MKSISILLIASLLLSYVFSARLTYTAQQQKCRAKCAEKWGEAYEQKMCVKVKAGKTVRDNNCFLSAKITKGNCQDKC